MIIEQTEKELRHAKLNISRRPVYTAQKDKKIDMNDSDDDVIMDHSICLSHLAWGEEMSIGHGIGCPAEIFWRIVYQNNDQTGEICLPRGQRR